MKKVRIGNGRHEPWLPKDDTDRPETRGTEDLEGVRYWTRKASMSRSRTVFRLYS